MRLHQNSYWTYIGKWNIKEFRPKKQLNLTIAWVMIEYKNKFHAKELILCHQAVFSVCIEKRGNASKYQIYSLQYLSRMSKGPKSRSSIASKFCTGPLPKFLVSSDNPLRRIPKDFTSFIKYRVDKQTIKIISFILNVVRMMFKLQTFCDRVQTKVSVLIYTFILLGTIVNKK